MEMIILACAKYITNIRLRDTTGYCETKPIITGFTSSSAFTGISNEYIVTTNIQSNDPDIVSKAVSLLGCTMQEAVWKIAEWVTGTIDYASSTTNTTDEDASEVFDRKQAIVQAL